MRKVRVWAALSDEAYHSYEGEARRRGVEVETLVEQTVNCLLQELEQEENEGKRASEEPLPQGSGHPGHLRESWCMKGVRDRRTRSPVRRRFVRRHGRSDGQARAARGEHTSRNRLRIDGASGIGHCCPGFLAPSRVPVPPPEWLHQIASGDTSS